MEVTNASQFCEKAMAIRMALASNPTFRCALASDVGIVVALVNSAYRGDTSRAGWTTEADILGGQRTDAAEILQLIEDDCSSILLCQHRDEVIGSVHVKRLDSVTAYMGMLVIKPLLQGQGLGRRFMSEAESFVCAEWGVERMQMQVITIRHELLTYYERRGYQRTGEIRLFPSFDLRFGLPKVNGLKLEVLEKLLDVGDANESPVSHFKPPIYKKHHKL